MSRAADSRSPIPNEDLPEILIEPSRGWASLQLGQLWEYRELLYFIVWRDVIIRYKQTVLGVGWAVLQPLLTMIVFSAVFGAFAKLPSDGVPYPIFTYVALLPWNYFSGSFGRAGLSVVNSANLISKVFFPRLVIPVSATLSGLVDFAIAFVILLGMMLFYHIALTPRVLALPLFMVLNIATALGVGLWLGALNVKYRDVGYIIPFLAQIWLYASPVAYSSSIVPAQLQVIYGLNPMVGVINGFRWALLGTVALDVPMTAVSSFIVVVLLVTGAMYFRRTEKTFADIV
jgi:lipopolysaccharide transport system permease protein